MTEYDPTACEPFDVAPEFEGELTVEDVAALISEPVELDRLEPDDEAGIEEQLEPPDSSGDTAAEEGAAETARAGAFPTPVFAPVSGRYASQRGPWRLDLRVDVDGARPLGKVSGDFYQRRGRTIRYFGSFVVDRPLVWVSAGRVTILGLARYTWSTSFVLVHIDIPRVPVFRPPAPVTLTFLRRDRTQGASYTCRFASRHFRTVILEQDSERGVAPFTAHDTGSLPSGGPARTLTIAGAYAEAGVQMLDSPGNNTIRVAPGGSWSDAELHAAMVRQFSLWRNLPQWKIWLLHARLHDLGPGLLGIMFDQRGAQRQGAAAFYAGIGGVTPADRREQLYTCVHELGHGFNLFHSFHKIHMQPPLPNRPAALSYMNYPRRFPGGEGAFWAAFPFRFDALESTHLRHGFLRDIIPGGNPFGRGAALEDEFEDAVEDLSGIELQLHSRSPSVALGEPVRVELRLAASNGAPASVHGELDPRRGFVQVGIEKPSGTVVAHEPMIAHCVRPAPAGIGSDRPVYAGAYVGYGREGLSFDAPGRYRLRAVYHALDGSQVLSNVLTLRVRAPVSSEDDTVADLLLGEDQGKLFALDGSDSAQLKAGNSAFEALIEKHPRHPLALEVMRVQGINALRSFKQLDDKGKTRTRAPNLARGIELVNEVLTQAKASKSFDSFAIVECSDRLARALAAAGREKDAASTLSERETLVREGGVKRESVIETIKSQGGAALQRGLEEHQAK